MELSGVSVLAEGARQLGLDLTDEQLEQFRRYTALLIDWSSRANLTAIKDPEGIQRRHFLESVALVCILQDHGLSLNGKSLIDIGSGAGVPGIPLKIVQPGLKVALLEATRRKAVFLEELVAHLGFDDVEIVTKRAEEAAHDARHRETYDVVTAKAVAPLRTLLELTLPFACVGGTVVAPKGTAANTEVKDAGAALEALNASLVAIAPMPLAVPEQRVVLVAKNSETADRFPRRPGVPTKHPL